MLIFKSQCNQHQLFLGCDKSFTLNWLNVGESNDLLSFAAFLPISISSLIRSSLTISSSVGFNSSTLNTLLVGADCSLISGTGTTGENVRHRNRGRIRTSTRKSSRHSASGFTVFGQKRSSPSPCRASSSFHSRSDCSRRAATMGAQISSAK